MRPAPARMQSAAAAPFARSAARATPRRSIPLPVLVLALVVALLVAVGCGAAIGPVAVSPPAVMQIVGHHLFGWWIPAHYSPIDEQIVWNLRLPQVLLAVLVGTGLSTVGATLQAAVRNPLADPYLLGVSSGAGLMAAAVITLGSAAVAGLSTASAAFGGAALSTVLVLGLAAGGGGRFAPTRVVLAGVTLSFLFLGLTNYLIFRSSDPNAAAGVLFWLLGSLSNAAWSNLSWPAAAVVVGVGYLFLQGRQLNALVAGEETALSVGINVRAVRIRLLVVTALITGALVAAAGGVSFVGLIVPHLVRLAVGPDHRRLLPISALAGATFMVLVNVVCQVAAQPQVLPLGVVTSVIGAPLFLALLRRSRSGALTR